MDVLKVPRWKHDTIIDCIASNNEVNNHSCDRRTIQERYCTIGECSKPADGTGYSSCPDLYQTICCTKNIKITHNIPDSLKNFTL